MSSQYVRTFARQIMPLMKTPFFETINQEIEYPNNAIWMTLAFRAYSMNRETYCQESKETGVISLVFFGTAGIGDQQLLEAVEGDSQFFYRQKDSSGLLTLEQLSPPEEASDGDGRPLYVMSVDVSYSYIKSLGAI